MYNVTCA